MNMQLAGPAPPAPPSAGFPALGPELVLAGSASCLRGLAFQSRPSSWQRIWDFSHLSVTPVSGVGAPRGSVMFTYLLKWLAVVKCGITSVSN